MKLHLLATAIVVDDAIRFVSDRSKEKIKSFSSSNSNDDYHEDKRSARRRARRGNWRNNNTINYRRLLIY
jgi:hypothetical protein